LRHGLDDFRALNPAQAPGGDRQVGMPDWALDHDPRERIGRRFVAEALAAPGSEETETGRPRQGRSWWPSVEIEAWLQRLATLARPAF